MSRTLIVTLIYHSHEPIHVSLVQELRVHITYDYNIPLLFKRLCIWEIQYSKICYVERCMSSVNSLNPKPNRHRVNKKLSSSYIATQSVVFNLVMSATTWVVNRVGWKRGSHGIIISSLTNLFGHRRANSWHDKGGRGMIQYKLLRVYTMLLATQRVAKPLGPCHQTYHVAPLNPFHSCKFSWKY
jgi:hypothetical protein